MALSGDLGDAGHVVETVKTTAKVTVEPKQGGGFSITGIALETVANVPQIADEDFQAIAEVTKKNCPVSRALQAVPITLKASLG
jgi:osmotically inducible protein OsmC